MMEEGNRKIIKNSELVRISKLLKEKKSLVKNHQDAEQIKHKINVIRKFIDGLANGNVENTIQRLEDEVLKLRTERFVGKQQMEVEENGIRGRKRTKK